ncbi:MAG: hypothetical protein PHF14_05145, partial [Verrucomicrobiota bacterium]|nr:hypothetical protein [Verrucomicrobiota bacterium]
MKPFCRQHLIQRATAGLCGLVLFIQSPALTLSATDLFVATNGNDAWSGAIAEPNADGTDGPLATVATAQQRVRALLEKSGSQDLPIRVLVRGGLYELDAPLEFAPEDSGTAAAPVVYQAFEGERPILS